jgi:ADP-dependent NAD(P)H-hydrate dehydratase / NAD(P)H-hydrate epimerase
MSYLVTTQQLRAAEQKAIDAGTSETDLMLAASEGMAAWIDAQFHSREEDRQVLGLVGPGKNGGDTLTVLALLADLGWNAHAVLVSRSDITNVPASKDLLDRIALVHEVPTHLADREVVVLDGIFGTGGRAELPGFAAEVLEMVRQRRSKGGVAVVAVDVPSGVDSDTGQAANESLVADATLSIGAMKQGLLREPAATLAGEIVTIDIGIEFEESGTLAAVIDRDSVAESLPQRFATAGKHDYGGVLVVGGAPMYFGAPRLSAEAALRVGTGLVGAAVPRMLVSTIAAQVPELVFVPLGDSDPRKSVGDITKAVTGEHSRFTAVVLGPGLGQDEAAKALLSHLFGQATTTRTAPIGFGASTDSETTVEASDSALASVPLVLDADALNWLAEQDNKWSFLANVQAVLTPHPGEMARLRGTSAEDVQSNRLQAATSTARESGQVVVLKGGYAVVAAPDGRVTIAHRATPELATPGTGDVLAGLIGGLLAQGMKPYEAACAAVYIGAEAGRLARFGMSSRSVIARDLIDRIGNALDDIDGSVW